MRHYPPTEKEAQRLKTNFTHHPPIGDQADRYQLIREYGAALADVIVGCCPPSRERALALTNVEQAVMWANAGIARNESEAPPAEA